MTRAAPWILAALVIFVCDDVVADEVSAADIVRVRSATPAEGPLPPPARVEARHTPRDLLDSLRTSTPDPSASEAFAPEVGKWAQVVEKTLERVGYPDADVDVTGSPDRLLEARTGPLGKSGWRARFLRAGADAGAALFDDRFEPFDAGGYYVREVEKPGDRAALTNVPDDPAETLVWQVGRVLVELVGADAGVAERIDAAAREAGTYAADLAVDDDPFGTDQPESGTESDDDLPFEEAGSDAPPAPVASYDIPSLRASVTSLRFFEGGSEVLPVDKRVYAPRFRSATTRLIWWELGLAYAAAERDRTFQIRARWTRQDGSVLVEQVFDGRLGATWTSSVHTKGHGQAIPMTWDRGSYRVDLWIAGKVVASGTFQVTSAARVSNVRLLHNQLDPHGQKGVLITFRLETWGRLGQETHVAAYVHFQDGKPLKDFDGQYVDANGNAATHVAAQPAYESAIWDSAQIFFPYTQMHLGQGKHELKVQLVVYEPSTGAPLARSPWATMSVTSN